MSYGGFYGGGIQPPTVTPDPTGHPNELVRRNPEDTGYTYLSVSELLTMLGSVSSVFGRTGVVVADLSDYATFYAPISHTHVIADISGLQAALDAKAALVHTHTASQITDFSEAVDDRVGALLVAGSGVTLSYNDVGNALTISAPAVGLSDGDKGDIAVSSSGAVWTVDNDVVSNAKLANMATSTIKGRVTAATGDPEDLTVAQAKTLLDLTGANSGDQTITLTSDVTGSGVGSFAATIAVNAVTNAKLSDVPTATFKGRATAGSGDPEDLTVAQAAALLISGAATTEVLFNNGGVIDGDADLKWDATNNLLSIGDAGGAAAVDLGSITVTAGTPAANTTRFFSTRLLGRSWLGSSNPDGFKSLIQPMMGSSWNKLWAVPNQTAGTAGSSTIGGGTTGQGTATLPALASTNFRTRNLRVSRTTTGSAGSRAGTYTDYVRWFRSGTAGLGGFRHECIFALGNDATGYQSFTGMTSEVLALVGDPSAIANIFGVGFDAADAAGSNFQIMHNDGSGTATRVSTGIARNTTDAFRIILDCPVGNATTLYWHLTNMNTGTSASGSVTTNLPVSNTPMATCSMVRNGAVAAAVAIELYTLAVDSPIN